MLSLSRSLEPTVAAGAELDEQVLPLAQAQAPVPELELELVRAPVLVRAPQAG